jgi:DNA primase
MSQSIDLRTLIPEAREGKDFGKYVKCQCPFHNDENPSLLVWKTFYSCKACGAEGDIYSYINYLKGKGENVEELVKSAPIKVERAVKHVPKVEFSTAFNYHLNLSTRTVDYYLNRGLTKKTIIDNLLGYGIPPFKKHPRYTIPIFHNGKIINIKFRRDDSCPICGKCSCEHEFTPLDTDEKFIGIAGHNFPF